MQNGRRTMPRIGEDQICNMTEEALLDFLKNQNNSDPDRKKAAQRLKDCFNYSQSSLEHALGEEQAGVIFGGKKKKIKKTGPKGRLRRGGGRIF